MASLQTTWDLLSRLLIKERPICQCCKMAQSTDNHHIVHRSKSKNLYFDETNILTLCHSCHSQFHGQTRYAKVFDDVERLEIIEKIIGWAGIEHLKIGKFTDKIWTDRELKELRKYYRERLKKAKGL